MARVGRWTTWALETAIEAVLDGASYDTAEALTGVPHATVRDHVLRRGLVRSKIPRPGRRRADESDPRRVLASTLGTPCPDEGGVVAKERKRRPVSFSLAEWEEIRVGIRAGESDTTIAERLGRHRSSVWREIKANGGRLAYRAAAADERAAQTACRPKTAWTEDRPWLWKEVQDLIRTKKWSPEQIAQRLGKDHPHQPEWWVSHEAIYQAIFVQAKGELRKEMAACLRSAARRRPRTRTSSGRGQITGRSTSPSVRPRWRTGPCPVTGKEISSWGPKAPVRWPPWWSAQRGWEC
jgi:hypothetical protein